MRNGQNNKRMRNRNNNNNNNNNNRRGQNPMTRVFESNGPDIKIRGTASHVAEKYVQLARDARSSGDPVAAENYYQHAEHYFRLIAAAQEQFRQNQPQPRTDNEMSPSEDGDEESENFSNFGQEPGFVPVQQQPFVPRDNHQREGQPYAPREQHPPREHNHNRDHRQQPQYQPQPQPQQQPQPVIADNGSVDRLPSFITGPQPQINGGPGFEGNGGERFPPRRRRRPHNGPRPENIAAPAPQGDDFNSGNE
ncbi:DUF4167 domain-containing protein [Bradyrhizobium canariense]|uniref:DUF4167 domain-containing protein n=1 Tax=Bradyrhizobium canariense TaxID=255045 RepID=A0A1H1ZJ01_9BRAD|nr:DUF4167 domain-containing protein [Bradyrhizobium canariense]SDT33609.1 protein of unknown function [Bradyrhizobium canariense]